MMNAFDVMSQRSVGRLHVITDMTLQSKYDHATLAGMAARGGADVIQMREKRAWHGRQWLEMAARVKAAIHDAENKCTDLRWLINDRIDVALASGAHGVHLGRDDIPAAFARRWMAGDKIIGATANSLQEAIRVAAEPIDYVGVGPVFATQSKAGAAEPLGLMGLHRIVQAVNKPVIAIGGIGIANVADVLSTGAHGIAVLSAVVCAADPVETVLRFREALDSGK